MKALGFSASSKRSRGLCSGFTLLEILVVISLIATLAALLTPALKNARDKARAAQCTSNMKQFGMAFQMYADTHNGWLPRNWDDNSYNWQSMLVDSAQGGNFLGQNDSARSKIDAWVPPCIRVTTKLLCPSVVQRAIHPPDGNYVTVVDPHDQWCYSYNHLRGSVSWEANNWPWFTISLMGVNTTVLYKYPAKYIIMCDGNGANYNPDDWDATTGDLAAYNYPIAAVHGEGVNALFLDGHIQFMPLNTAEARTTFNRAFYAGLPIAGNPYVND
jgi:prepilin-type N-terminal cleavage/methylation domain-containing protein/prepilin-type processing-associated H-X9-DG protein